eukprot:gene27887-12004_t
MAWQDVNRNTSWSKPIVTRDSMTSSGGSSSSSSSVAWLKRTIPSQDTQFRKWQIPIVTSDSVASESVTSDSMTNDSVTSCSGGSTAWLKRTIPSQDTQARPGLGAALEHMARPGLGAALEHMARPGLGAALEHIVQLVNLLEHMVQLVNLLGAAPWFNVHHLADDGYVLAMATLLRDTLRPDIQVYIEHSNEVWNQGFPQYAFASAQGLALNLSSDPRIAAYRYHAWRTVAIATIFRNVFAAGVGGGSSGGGADRVKVVLGGWGFICNGGSGCGAEVMRETMGWNGTALKMVAQCNATLGAAVAASLAVATAAAPFGVPLITYEAGPSIVEASAIASGSITPGLMSKFIAVNRDPDMYRLYSLYLDAYWKQGLVAAGRPWMQFVSTAQPSQYGSWGLQEYTGQTASEASKFCALMDWLDLRADEAAAAKATGNEYTSQRASKAPKYRMLMVWLDQRADEAAAAKATGNEYTGQRASKAPKYRVLMDWLDLRADEAAAAKATGNEYTGQRASKALKYRVLMNWLDLRADEAAAAKATGNAGLLQHPATTLQNPATPMTQP